MNGPTQSVFESVALRPSRAGLAGLSHLTWRAPQQGDRLVQVYVDGSRYATTADPTQRSMWLWLDHTAGHWIELLAVDCADALVDRSSHLTADSPRPRTTTELALRRDESLDVEATVRVSVDGKLDHVSPLWAATDHRSGFGGLFGIGRFGHDDATALGFGFGDLGGGVFGEDNTFWRWRRNDLPAGDHVISAEVVDRFGRTIGQLTPSPTVSIDKLPGVAQRLTIDPDFTLRWEATNA